MPKRLRLFASEEIYFVTQRCSEERAFLEPSVVVNRCIGSWIARGQERYRVDIVAYVVMSNHWHFVVRATENNLSRFMAYVAGNVARAVNRIHSHHGDVWEERFSAQPILDEPSLQDRIEYTEWNPVRAGLCGQPDEWCGLSSAKHAEYEMPFEMLHKREWQRSSSRAESRVGAHTKTHKLRITRLLEGMRLEVMDFLRRDPFTRPVRPKRTRAPLCFGLLENWRRYRDKYRAFCDEYRIASAIFLEGVWDTAFPSGSFRPPIFHIVPTCQQPI